MGTPAGQGLAGRSDLIEGRRAVEEALGAGVPLKSALVQIQSLDADPALERLAQRLDAAGVSVERVPRNRLDQLSSHGAHQGVIVRAKPFQYAELGDVIAAAGKGNALVLVLDHVTDEGNFGAIVRTAEVVGAAGVVIAKARSASVGVGAYKTSAGAVLHIPIAQVSNLARAVEELKAAGFWACASTEHATDDVWSAPLAGRVALVMGSEGEGISFRCSRSATLPASCRSAGAWSRSTWHRPARSCATSGCAERWGEGHPWRLSIALTSLVVDGYNVIFKSGALHGAHGPLGSRSLRAGLRAAHLRTSRPTPRARTSPRGSRRCRKRLSGPPLHH